MTNQGVCLDGEQRRRPLRRLDGEQRHRPLRRLEGAGPLLITVFHSKITGTSFSNTLTSGLSTPSHISGEVCRLTLHTIAPVSRCRCRCWGRGQAAPPVRCWLPGAAAGWGAVLPDGVSNLQGPAVLEEAFPTRRCGLAHSKTLNVVHVMGLVLFTPILIKSILQPKQAYKEMFNLPLLH